MVAIDDEHPISYFSQKLSASERKYSVTERECLAVIRAIEKFRGYVEGIRAWLAVHSPKGTTLNWKWPLDGTVNAVNGFEV